MCYLQVNVRLMMLDFTSALVAAAGSEELQQQVGMLKDGVDCFRFTPATPEGNLIAIVSVQCCLLTVAACMKVVTGHVCCCNDTWRQACTAVQAY